MRLFISVNFTKELSSRLTGEIAKLRALAQKGGYPLRQNLHLTLVFLGDTPVHRLRDLSRAIDKLSFKPFTLCITGLSSFEEKGERVYWRGIAKSDELSRLRRELVRELIFEGFFPDSRPFKPHITLARRCVLSPEDEQTLARSFEDTEMRVERISLMSSERVDGRLKYTELFFKSCEKESAL